MTNKLICVKLKKNLEVVIVYIANELKKSIISDDIYDMRIQFIDILNVILNKFIEDKSMFTLDNFYAMYLDEIATNTNCNENIINTIYLEINQPLNYKLDKIKVNSKENSKIIIPELFLTLDEIIESLYNLFLSTLDSNNIVWREKYSICLKSTVFNNNNDSKDYYFKIIPCFTHYNKSNKRGVLYYHNKDIEIEFPEIYLENFNKKNKSTKDIYRQIILIFKNILLKEKDIDYLPSEIIETIVYNIPNTMLKTDSKDNLLSIINYLRNHSIKEYKTIDEQDFAFSSMYRSMSIFYVKRVIKIIEKFLINN